MKQLIFNDDIANDNNFKLLGNTAAQPAPNTTKGILINATIAVPL